MSENNPAQDAMGLSPTELDLVKDVVRTLLRSRQPSAWELFDAVETKVDLKARWLLPDVLKALACDDRLVSSQRPYCESMSKSDDLTAALCGLEAPKKEIMSTIDVLLRQSSVYRKSAEFQAMLDFVARFREYAPFNNMLVRTQMPACSYFATEKDWLGKFGRHLIEDPRPLLILAPMHPVMLVYDVDQTEGKNLPKQLTEFAKFEGDWKLEWLELLIENAARRDRISVSFKPLTTSYAGFATIARGDGGWKMRIVIHDRLDGPSRFGVLCHELAHIYLGHLGSDKDHWWPSRRELSHRTVEIEAEAVAFLVTARKGLTGASARYVAGHVGDDPIPPSVSLDLVGKVSGRIERMTTEKMTARK